MSGSQSAHEKDDEEDYSPNKRNRLRKRQRSDQTTPQKGQISANDAPGPKPANFGPLKQDPLAY